MSGRTLWLPPSNTEPAYRPDPDAEERADYEPHGYMWCRPCRDWHRPPECAIDAEWNLT